MLAIATTPPGSSLGRLTPQWMNLHLYGARASPTPRRFTSPVAGLSPMVSQPRASLCAVLWCRFALLFCPSRPSRATTAGRRAETVVGPVHDDDGQATSLGERTECLTASRRGQRRGLIPKRCRYAPALPAGRRVLSLPAPGGGAVSPLHDPPGPPQDLSS